VAFGGAFLSPPDYHRDKLGDASMRDELDDAVSDGGNTLSYRFNMRKSKPQEKSGFSG